MTDKLRPDNVARVAFQRMNLQPGEVIVIKVAGDFAQEQMEIVAEQFRPVLEEYRVNVLFVDSKTSIEQIDELQMKQHGWIRDPNWFAPPSSRN